MIRLDDAQCDLCGKVISLIDPKERVNKFRITLLDAQLVCHNECRDLFVRAEGNLDRLPDGPLRKVLADFPNLQNPCGDEHIVCAWCNKVLKAGHPERVLHGMCENCYDGKPEVESCLRA